MRGRPENPAFSVAGISAGGFAVTKPFFRWRARACVSALSQSGDGGHSLNVGFEVLQFVGGHRMALQQEACHLSAAHLRIDDDSAPFPFLHDLEFRRNHLHFPAYAAPVEEAFHFGTGQIDQDAVVGLDGADEVVGEQGLPVVEACGTVFVGQAHVALQPVRADGVEGAQQSVEEGGDEKMLLGIFQVGPHQALGRYLSEHDAGVGGKGRQFGRAGIKKVAVAQCVFCGDFGIDMERDLQVCWRKGGQLAHGSLRLAGEGRCGGEGDVGIDGSHGFGAGYEYLHIGSALGEKPGVGARQPLRSSSWSSSIFLLARNS